MNRNVSIGQYYPGNSVLHRMDPRIKIVLSLLFMVSAILSNTWMEFLTLSVFTIIMVTASKIPFKTVARSTKPIIPLILFAAVVNAFAVTGTPIFQIWIFAPTYEGLYLAGALTARIFLIIVGGSSLLIFTTTPIVLTDGIERLLGPLKKLRVPVHEIAMMMTIALRFIPTLIDEADKIMKAQASRGADFNEGKLMDRVKSFIPIIVPLFVSAFRRADELANAMEARCYRGDEGRTKLRQLKISKIDINAMLIFMIFFGSFIIIKLSLEAS